MTTLDVTIGALPVVAEHSTIAYEAMELRTVDGCAEILTAPEWLGIAVDLLKAANPDLLSIDTVDGTLMVHGTNRIVTYRMVAVEPDGLVVICQRTGDA